MMIWKDEWWGRFRGPQRFIEESLTVLQNRGVVLLDVPEDLCWRHAFRLTLWEKLGQWHGSSVSLEELDVREDCPEVSTELDAGYAVLNALSRLRNTHYHMGRSSAAEYLNQKGPELFQDCVLWVKGFHTPEACSAFSKLCGHCKQGRVRIILEDSTGFCKSMANLKRVRYLDYVSSFDTQLLCMMVVNEIYSDLPLLWREYLTVLSAQLCGLDAELAAILLEQHDLSKEPVLAALMDVAESGALPQRGAKPDHILYHLRQDSDGGRSCTARLEWKAQLQIGLPILERGLKYAIDQLRNEIDTLLASETIMQFNEQVSDRNSLETGTLWYLVNTGKLQVNDKSVSKLITFLRNNRNILAHYDLCSLDTMGQVFDLGRTLGSDGILLA